MSLINIGINTRGRSQLPEWVWFWGFFVLARRGEAPPKSTSSAMLPHCLRA